MTGDKKERSPGDAPQFGAHESQLANARAVPGKFCSDQDERVARIIAAHFQQTSAVERPQRRNRKITVVDFMDGKRIAPKQRLTAAVGPSAIKPRGKRKRVACIDAVYCEECRRFGGDAFGKVANRTGPICISGYREANRYVGQFYRIDFPRPEQINSTASDAV